MSPGWQINKAPEPVAEAEKTVDTPVDTIEDSPVVAPPAVPAREIPSHVVGGTATALDTQRRLIRVNAETAKKGRAKFARASAAAKKSAVAKTAATSTTVAVTKKAGTRRKGREMAMQMLFQADIGKQTPEQVRNSFWNAAEKVDPDTRGFAEDLFRIATTRDEEIDTLIEAHSANWRLPRMAAVDRNLLRAATAEFLGFPGTPVPIVINESLEIARRYSAPESINFLNGVLDAISRSRH